ncbi:MAG: ABC transporter substrate-binding protein [Christensenellales bacterium]|jgi:oligopeptide transport system substrate-binding protein
MKKHVSILMALVMALSLLGSLAIAEEAPAIPDDGKQYTYQSYMGASPINWNPHAWEMSNENTLMGYIEAPFVDTTIAEDGVNFEWIYELATAVTDVTADFAEKEKFGIPADATEHWVYQIDINPLAKWDDGTPINADTLVYSMKTLLDPAMKNYRSNSYTDGTTAIKNAKAYFENDKVGQIKYADVSSKEGYADVADADMQFSLTEKVVFFDNAAKAYYEGGYADYFKAEDGTDLYAKYVVEGADAWLPLTEEAKADLLVIAKAFGDDNEEAYKEFARYQTGIYEETPWEMVGLIKTGEYSVQYILETKEVMFYMLSSLTSPWIVHEGLYEAGKETIEGLVATNYGTSKETYSATGPYRIASFEVDKQIVLERNPYWFGYHDGNHEGQYMTDTIKIDIIGEHTTALLLFNQGKLDEVSLTGDDMAIYRMSDYLLKTDLTYTFRYIFATSLESLTALEEEANDGANKKVLSYRDFRKALSLAIDRNKLTAEGTAGFKPAYYLLNYLYYYDIANNTESQYRNTTEAKEAVLRLYGIEYGEGKQYADVDAAFDSVTGYDVEEARALFQSVYEQAIADGNYTDGQAININCMASAAEAMTPDDTRQQDLMNEFAAEATKGTGFEGKINFKFSTGSKTRYEDVAAGKVEMIRGAWGGAAFYPFSTIRVYCEPDYMGGMEKIHESNGWDPTKETLKITYDFNKDGTEEELEKTLQDWAKAMNGTGEYAADPDACMVILSNLETAILSSYQCIPWGTDVDVSIRSQKIEYATYDYNIMYAYGGLRLMTFNYDDAEWEAYVAEQGGTLNYE